MNKLIVGLVLLFSVSIANAADTHTATLPGDFRTAKATLDAICIEGYRYLVVRTPTGVAITQMFNNPLADRGKPSRAVKCKGN